MSGHSKNMKGKFLPKKQDLDYQDDFVIGMHMTQDPHGFSILKMIGLDSAPVQKVYSSFMGRLGGMTSTSTVHL